MQLRNVTLGCLSNIMSGDGAVRADDDIKKKIYESAYDCKNGMRSLCPGPLLRTPRLPQRPTEGEVIPYDRQVRSMVISGVRRVSKNNRQICGMRFGCGPELATLA